jgi:phage-related protein
MTAASRYIRQANSELDKATAGVEDWADTTDGLQAKIGQLNKVLDAQGTQVAALKVEYERVAKEQGENSAGAQNLAIRLNKAEAAVKKTKAEIDKYSKSLEDNGKDTKETEKETVQMSAAFDKAAKAAGTLAKKLAGMAGKAVVTGIKGIAAASAGLVTAFLATGEASKEQITSMAKLNAAYKSSGHTAETAAKTYGELYSVIGETDQAVEAAQQIALLANSEKDAASWAELGAGVIGKFGDALQPEAFFEAANETIKLGEATGAYTQMIEQSGLSVDKFNKGLAKCKTEEQKQAYMLEYTQQALAGAGDAYREANAAVIENNKANAALQEQLAAVGETALPITTAFKNIGAAILGDLMPNIKTLGTSFTEALGGSKTAAQEMGTAVGGMLQTLGQKIVNALPTILTVGTSIITSLVQGLVQATPQLAAGVTQIVQYFIQSAPQLLQAGASMIASLVGAIRSSLPQLLKAGGDMLYQLIDGLVSNLPAMAQGAMDAIGGFVNGIQTYLPIILSKGAELLGKLGEGIRTGLPGLVNQGLDILMNFATSLYDNAPKLIETGFDFISNLVQGILDSLPALISKGPEIISKFANIINDNVPKLLKKGMELVIQIVKGIIAAIPTLIKNIPKIITAIVDVWEAFNWLNLGKKALTAVKNGITSMLGAIKTAGKNVLDSITNALKALPSNLLNLGKTAIGNMRNGITSMLGAVRSAGSNVLSAVVNIIKALPGKLLSFGKSAITGLGNAIKSGVTTVRSKATAIMSAVTGALKSLPQKLLNIGKDLVRGLWNGISDMTGWIINKIKSFGESVLSGIKKFFGINSPSKVMAAEVGKWLPAGMAEGILGNTKAAVKAMTNMAQQALGAANAELSGATINGPTVNGTGAPGAAGGRRGATYVFNQYNNSPKALSRKDIYRQTNNALKFATAKG